MTLNSIAVDDEPPALDLLCRFIERTPFLKLAGSFSNGIEALRAVAEQEIDLIFLDIQMPDLSGIELARILSGRKQQRSPLVIFTTAFDQYALEGYKLDVLDYLLKPFSYDEFYRAAEKSLDMARLKTGAAHAAPAAEVKAEEFIYLKVEYQTVKIACSHITYIEGLKDYAKIHLDGVEKPVLSIITLKALEEKLPAGKFMRIHKSFIVSLDRISSVSKNLIFIGNTSMPVSEQYRDAFSGFLAGWK